MSQDTTPRVTTRQLNWKEMVQKAWGKEYNKPDTAYQFSGNRTFDDKKTGGPYGPQS